MPQDVIKDDLKRLMYDKQQDETEIRVEFEESGIVRRSEKHKPKHIFVEYTFSDPVRIELSKAKPEYAMKKYGSIFSGVACCLLAIFAAISLPQPLNWILAVGCFWPFAIAVMKRKKRHGRISRHNTENRHL